MTGLLARARPAHRSDPARPGVLVGTAPRPIEVRREGRGDAHGAIRRETGIGWVAEKVGAAAIAATRAALDVTLRSFDAPGGEASDDSATSASVDAPPGSLAQVVERVHVAGVGAIPLVCMVAAGTGAAIVLQGTMAPQPPSPELGRLLVVVVLREIAPLFTCLLVAGHSGSLAADEVAGAPSSLRARARAAHVAGTSVAVVALAIHFAAIAMAAAFVTSACVTLRTYGAVRDGLLHEIALFDAPLVFGKAALLGAIVGWLGLRAADERRGGASEGRTASRMFTRALLSASGLSVGLTLCLYAIVGAPPPP